ncbi:MAG: hypothetical protein AB1846_15495, partial [Chloroflexota bacterium]
KAGQVIVVTERGKAIGLITPLGTTVDSRMKALAEAGFLEWERGRPLKPYRPKIINRGDRLVSDMVAEDRR